MQVFNAKDATMAVFAHWENCARAGQFSSSQSENVTYKLHAACGYVKLQSEQTYGICMTEYII